MKAILPLFLCAAAFAQTAAKLEFEVASIKPAEALGAGNQVSIGIHVDGAQVNISSLTLKDFIRIAWRVKDYQIMGPDWIGHERFTISAKLPAGGNRDQVPEMLQTLLTERFHIQMHRDKKEFPVYALLVAKGGPTAKLKESPQQPEAETSGPGEPKGGGFNATAQGGPAGVMLNLGAGSYFSFGNNQLEGKKLDMPRLADTLSRFTDRPIVDMTDLKGSYDFLLTFSPEDYRAMLIRSAISAGVSLPPEALRYAETASGDSLMSSMQTLGLKMEARKAPLDVIVIDKLDRTPADN